MLKPCKDQEVKRLQRNNLHCWWLWCAQCPHPSFLIKTLTPGTTELEESLTKPEIEATSDCANALNENIQIMLSIVTEANFFMATPSFRRIQHEISALTFFLKAPLRCFSNSVLEVYINRLRFGYILRFIFRLLRSR